MRSLPGALRETLGRIGKPVIALLGALHLGQPPDDQDGDPASTIILGDALASITGGAWKYFAPILGALGSFFRVHHDLDLAVGEIQASIAQDTGLDVGRCALPCAGHRDGRHDRNSQHHHHIRRYLVNVEGEILKKGFLRWSPASRSRQQRHSFLLRFLRRCHHR